MLKDFILKHWVQALFTAVLAILSGVVRNLSNRLRKEAEDQKCIKLGVQAILRNQIIEAYNMHKRMGYCEVHDKDNIMHMYDQYHKLGENGVIDKLMIEIMGLPTKKSPKEQR